MRSKRAQIGDTMSWFVAMIVLFTILVIFVFLALSLTGKKELYSSNSGGVVNTSKNLISQRELFYFLSKNIEYGGRTDSVLNFLIEYSSRTKHSVWNVGKFAKFMGWNYKDFFSKYYLSTQWIFAKGVDALSIGDLNLNSKKFITLQIPVKLENNQQTFLEIKVWENKINEK